MSECDVDSCSDTVSGPLWRKVEGFYVELELCDDHYAAMSEVDEI